MKISKSIKASKVIKFEVRDGKKSVGRVFLYVIKNDLHTEAYGYIEDLFVDEALRGQGYGKKLLQMVILEAKKRKLYKLVGTSRTFRTEVHAFYQKFGFKKYGFEFRKELND